MKKASQVLLTACILIIPLTLYQNCAEFLTPSHNIDGSNSAASVDALDESELKIEAAAIVQTECASCHSPGINSGSLGVTDGPGLIAAGNIVVGQPEASSFYTRLQSGMPPTGDLNAYEQEVIRQWILRGNPGAP